MQQENKKHWKAGRKPKDNPAIFRYSVSFNATEQARFLTLFEQSGMKVKAHFIAACIFNRTVKVVKIDKAAMDYYMRLTSFYSQFRGVGVNYNQVVKALKSNFSEKKALAFLYKLEKATLELVKINQQIIQLTQEFEEKWLQK
ncbi:conjugal transfer protein MobA [Petrimonas sp.]|uniref:conjugal transfer protein MobA n=1 Tax=Petrimonas sp. TaxID=2023866 RepID=UPI003F517070